MGVAVGDYDNDGFDDLFITALGQSHLFHNNGNGTFTDVTKSAGHVGAERVFDQRRLGGLRPRRQAGSRGRELRAVVASRAISIARSTARTSPIARRSRTRALRRDSGTTWATASLKTLPRKPDSAIPLRRAWASPILDYNDDGWPDILIANDTQPNKLYLNKKNGTFEERAVAAGIAFSEDGVARAGMGVDAADYDRSGHASLIITNFANQMLSLYHNEGNGLFVDEAPQLGSWPRHAGHARLRLLLLRLRQRRLAGHLRRRRPHRRSKSNACRSASATPSRRICSAIWAAESFRKSRRKMGAAFAAPKVARGAAYADIDNDGALDVLLTTNGGPAYLFHNEGGTNHSLRIKLVGTKSNRDGIGAVVRVTSGSDKQWQMLRSRDRAICRRANWC